MDLMVIENDLELVKKLESAGIERIFIDLELRAKHQRQAGMNTVISNHTLDDVSRVRNLLTQAKLLVRCNAIFDKSEEEIDQCIDRGADIIMLPMFTTKNEVESFVQIVNKRTKTCLLLETAQAFSRIDDILTVDGIDEVHIGLNDLHLSLGLKFMFEPLGCGLVDYLAEKFLNRGMRFGFGGVARMSEGMLPGEMIIKEHVRLGSNMVILSRSFRSGIETSFNMLEHEVLKLRSVVTNAQKLSKNDLMKNSLQVKELIYKIVARM